ncbi:MAG: DNA ligase D [Gemmatimonadota bacterium]
MARSTSAPPRAQLARLAAEAPAGAGWLHEIKYDGYRILAVVRDGRVRLLSRNGKDWTARLGPIADAVAALELEEAVLDGEVAVQLPDGSTSFQALQNARAAAGADLRYFLFDVLEADGRDLRARPLEERKAWLEALLKGRKAGVVAYSEHVVGNGPAFFAQACRHGLEGIISKRSGSPYRAGRGGHWLKVKCSRRQEFVVGGFTEAAGARSHFGALLVGAHDASGNLRYAGKVGTGFTAAVLRKLHDRLQVLERPAPPFSNPPRGAGARGVHWVEPAMVVEVAFTEMTGDGSLRHPSFKGLREDKPAADVVFEDGQEEEVTTESGPSKAAPTRVAGVRLTSPDRVLYKAQGITKLDLARYYEAVAEWMLPHVRNRPLTLVRCPTGYQECFYQKHIEASSPESIVRVEVNPDDPRPYGAVDSAAGLVALAQIGALELHTWGARRDRLERPDRFTLDLDPDPSVPWKRVLEAAFQLRDLLDELGLRSFPKTTGGKGLHLVVPIERRSGWDEVKEFSRRLGAVLEEANPGRYTLNISKAKRQGRVLIDYLRNGRGATAVEVYSTRARAGAPVAVPVRWDELGPKLKPDRYNIKNLPRRLASLREDPWAEYFDVRQSITAAMRRAVGMTG